MMSFQLKCEMWCNAYLCKVTYIARPHPLRVVLSLRGEYVWKEEEELGDTSNAIYPFAVGCQAAVNNIGG